MDLTQVGQNMWKILVSFDLHAHESMNFNALIFTKLKTYPNILQISCSNLSQM